MTITHPQPKASVGHQCYASCTTCFVDLCIKDIPQSCKFSVHFIEQTRHQVLWVSNRGHDLHKGLIKWKGVRKEKVRIESQTSIPQVLPTEESMYYVLSNRQKDHCNLQTNECHFRQYHQSFPGHYQSSFPLAAARLMARVQRIDRTLRTDKRPNPSFRFQTKCTMTCKTGQNNTA